MGMSSKRPWSKSESRLRDSIQYCHQLAHKLYQNRKLCEKKPELLLGLEEQVDALMQARRVLREMERLGELIDPDKLSMVDASLILEVLDKELASLKEKQDEYDDIE